MKLRFFLILMMVSTSALADPVLLPLAVKHANRALTEEVIDQVRIQLHRRGIEAKEADPASTPATTPSRLVQALDKAREDQLNLREKEAAETVSQALSELTHETPTLKDLAQIGDAWLLLALCQKDLGQAAEMTKSLEEAARLNPTLHPTEMLYPPSLLKLFEQAKDRIWKTGVFTELTITSSPAGASVFVNGSFKGKTPLRLDRYPVGGHHLLILDDKGRQDYRYVVLKEGSGDEIKMHPSDAPQKGKKNLHEADVSDLKAQKKWMSAQGFEKAVIGIGIADLGDNKLGAVINPVSVKKLSGKALELDDDTVPEMIAKTLVDKSRGD